MRWLVLTPPTIQATDPTRWQLTLSELSSLFGGPTGVVLLLIVVPLAVAFGRFILPVVALSFASLSAVARAACDALLGLSATSLPMLILATELGGANLGILGALSVVFGVPILLGVVWGARQGTRVSGGSDDLTDGKARVIGAMLGLIVAAMLAAFG